MMLQMADSSQTETAPQIGIPPTGVVETPVNQQVSEQTSKQDEEIDEKRAIVRRLIDKIKTI